MVDRITRRGTLGGMAGLAALGPALAATPAAIASAIEAQERKLGGRIGVAAWDLGSRVRVGYRAEERFPLLSTFKVLAAGLVLARVDRGDDDIERRIVFGEPDLVAYSPVTRGRVHGAGMSVFDLCEAAITQSDNTAGNLLLASFGGPEALTAWLRGIGDETTRLDRIETELNEAKADDPRDTTSPDAMMESVRKLLFGDLLSQRSRDWLTGWLVGNKTGDRRIRAGMPKGWRVGDKTGTGLNGAAADVAIAWPPDGRAPLMIVAYLHRSKAGPTQLDDAIAEIGRRSVTLS